MVDRDTLCQPSNDGAALVDMSRRIGALEAGQGGQRRIE